VSLTPGNKVIILILAVFLTLSIAVSPHRNCILADKKDCCGPIPQQSFLRFSLLRFVIRFYGK